MKSMTVHSGGVVILTDRAARVAQSLEEQVRVLEEEEGTIACVREGAKPTIYLRECLFGEIHGCIGEHPDLLFPD